jgi:hypothetical protein
MWYICIKSYDIVTQYSKRLRTGRPKNRNGRDFSYPQCPLLSPAQHAIPQILGCSFLWLKRLHAEVKHDWSCIYNPQYVFMVWCLIKQRGNYTFPFHKEVITKQFTLYYIASKITVVNYWSYRIRFG